MPLNRKIIREINDLGPYVGVKDEENGVEPTFEEAVFDALHPEGGVPSGLDPDASYRLSVVLEVDVDPHSPWHITTTRAKVTPTHELEGT